MSTTEETTRLDRIETLWPLIDEAHSAETHNAREAMSRLYERYQPAIQRYLLGALRDQHAADEVAQQFAVKLLNGGFHRADAAKGRFRDYLKTALIRLVTEHHRRVSKAGVSLETRHDELADNVFDDQDFDTAHRESLLEQTWQTLHAFEQTSSLPYYSVLRIRADYPSATSRELANVLSDRSNPSRTFTETNFRKTLQRARRKFAEFLFANVAQSLRRPSFDEIERELLDLGLKSCLELLDTRTSQRYRSRYG